jgi:hypothetical protein
VRLQLALGLGVLALGWGSSLAGLEPLRRSWFDLVWTGYVLAADALVWRRNGRSLLHGGGWRAAALCALSAPFWWAFEIANWRLENWRYVGETASTGLARLPFKTLSFALVLPALVISRDLLGTLVRLPDPPAVRLPAWTARAMVAAGLLAVPLLYAAPGVVFPLLWVAPFLVLDGVAALRGRPSALALLRAGRAAPLLAVALAGLGTGLLWELWNWHALPHWQYRIPHVGALAVFAMPVLGYLGYPPFALSADAVVRTVLGGRGGLAASPATELGVRGSQPAQSVTD